MFPYLMNKRWKHVSLPNGNMFLYLINKRWKHVSYSFAPTSIPLQIAASLTRPKADLFTSRRAFRRPIGRTIMMLCCGDESRARFVVIGTQLARSELELRFVRFDGAFDVDKVDESRATAVGGTTRQNAHRFDSTVSARGEDTRSIATPIRVLRSPREEVDHLAVVDRFG